MEEVITKEILASSNYIAEQTSFLELSAFPGSSCKNLVTEGPVTAESIGPWIRQEGEFAPQSREDVKNSGNLRMLFQQAISHNSFQDGYITLPKSTWQDALEKNILSPRIFELASCPGLVICTDMNFIPTNSTFEIVMQRASSKPTSAKWTLSLHHDIKSRETSGFYKATTNSNCQAVLKKLKSCSSQVGNPFLLPMLIFQEELGRIRDRQRDIRRQVRRIEDALGLRLGRQADTNPYTFNDGTVDFEFLNRELVECNAQLQKQTPMVYLEALKNLEEAMEVYGAAISSTIDAAETVKCHVAFISRLRFQQRRIRVIETYHSVTSARLTAQANALYNLIAQKDNKLNYLVAVESRRIAAASKYEGTAMRTISILGIVFLPGTFVASILSTSFFDFQTATVSHSFWIYWAITVPLTLAVLFAWILWYRTNKHNHLELDKQLELSMPNLAERRLSAK